MAVMTTPRDLFLHELGDVLYVERKLVDEVLPKLIGEVRDQELRKGLEKHLEQTRGHVTNVEQAFDEIGERPHAEECIGFEGLKAEHNRLASEASPDLIDLVDAGAAARTEHYEIAAYSGLIEMARALGEQNVVTILEENMKQDKEALRGIESATKTLRDEMKAMAS
jgi:ferritin-like metal-binding protein YciE